MLKEEIRFERRKAVLLTVDFSGTVEEYSMAWLKLTNNAREYKDAIWKIYNSCDNDVYVICNPKHVEAVKEFCDGIVVMYCEKDNSAHYIGKVTDEQEITVGVPIYEYESTCDLDDPQWEEDMDSAVSHWDWLAVECN